MWMLIVMCLATSHMMHCADALAVIIDESPAPAPSAEDSEEELQARTSYERFLKLLMRQPKPGAALDRVCTFHIERGSMPQFVNSLEAAAKANTAADAKNAADANSAIEVSSSWLLLGLIEQRQGNHQEAAAALSQAAQLRPNDLQANWQLGRSLVALSRFQEAAQALERAVELSQEPTEQLPIFQDLQRAFRRAGQPEKARGVLKRMEQLFGENLRVKEQIAMGLNEDGDLEGALQRYSDLATLHRDPHQATQFAFTAAQLKSRLGRIDESIRDLEQQLEKLDPESWLHREARRRIEDTLRQSQDPTAVVTYYENWMHRNPDDIDAMSRLAKALASSGRQPEAQTWYLKALDRAPTSVPLRKAYINELLNDRKYQEAITQYEQLHAYQPGDSDVIEAWGQLILRHPDLPDDLRRSKAADVWRLLLKDRSDDAVEIAHVATLMRQFGLQEESLPLYKRAIELAADEPQHREDAGAVLWSLKRHEEAQSVWNSIAEGSRRSTQSLIRLSEVRARFRLHDLSLDAFMEACSLSPEFSDRIRLARRLREIVTVVPTGSLGRVPDDAIARALEQLALADAMVESEDQRAQVREERLACLTAGNLLDTEITRLAAELPLDIAVSSAVATKDAPNSSDVTSEELVSRLLTLATYAEANQQYSLATQSIEKATTIPPANSAVWVLAATLYEKTGRNADAVSAHRQLIALDRRMASSSLKKIAKLEQRLGHFTAALEAARELVAANPEDMDHVQFHASLCFELGQAQEGRKSLHRMVRLSSSDSSMLLKLGHELANHGDPAEGMEIYWRALDATTDVETQANIASSLATLHLKVHQFDRLIARLEERSRDFEKRRGSILALATAFQVAGDLVSARSHLEALADDGPADENLLALQARVCEDEGDLPAAAEYVARMEEIAPSRSNRIRLAGLFVKCGEPQKAEAVWRQMASSVPLHEHIRVIDQAIASQDLAMANTLARQVLEQDAKNWEALVRLVILEWVDGNVDESLTLAGEVVELSLASDAPAANEMWVRSQPGGQASTTDRRENPIVARWERVVPWIRLLQPKEDSNQGTLADLLNDLSALSSSGLPKDFGEARIISRSVLWLHAKRQNRELEFLNEVNPFVVQGTESGTDIVLFHALNNKQMSSPASRIKMVEAAFQMAKSQNVSYQGLYLFIARAAMAAQQIDANSAESRLLNAPQLTELIRSYEAVLAQHPEWTVPESTYEILGGTPDPQVIVAAAGKVQAMPQVEELCLRLLDESSSAQEVYAGLWVSVEAERCTVAETLQQLDRVFTLSLTNLEANPESFPSTDAIAVIKRLALNAQNAGDEESLQTVLEWWLHQGGHHLRQVRSRSLASTLWAVSQEKDAVNRLVKNVTEETASKYYPQGRMKTGMSAGNALQLYPLLMREEMTLWQELSKKNASQDSQSASVQWAVARLSTAAPEQRLTLHAALAAASWQTGSVKDVTAHMEALAALQPKLLPLQLSLLELYAEQDRYDEALALLEVATADDSSLIRPREILALHYAEKAKNSARAKTAGQRLLELQLTREESQFAAKTLEAAGLAEMAKAARERFERSVPASVSPTSNAGTQGAAAPVVLLDLYVQQGKTEAAVQIALQLIRRTQGGGTPWRNTQHGTPEQIRERAFRVLKDSGELDRMIAREKAQLEKSPHSRLLMQKLIEYLDAAGRSDEVAEIRDRLIANMKGNSTDSLQDLAEQLKLAGKRSEACDAWLRILELDPVEFWNHAESVELLMADAGRLPDLTNAIIRSENAPPQKYVKAADLFSLLRRLTEKPELHRDAGILLGFIIERHPESTVDAISSIENKQAWQSPELFELLVRLYAPHTEPELAASRYVWPERYASNNGSDGHQPTISLGLLDGLLKSDVRRVQLQQAIEECEKAYPAWPGSVLARLILALQNQNSEAEVQKLVTVLTANPEKRLPEALAYELARLMMAHTPPVKRQAVPLLEASLNDVRTSQIHLGTPALGLLADLYLETQQQRRGCQFLLSLNTIDAELKTEKNESAKHRLIGTQLSLSTAFLKLGEPIAAWNCLNDITDADAAACVTSIRAFGYEFIDREWIRNHSPETIRLQILSSLDPRFVTHALQQGFRKGEEDRTVAYRQRLAIVLRQDEANIGGLRRLECPLLKAISAQPVVAYSPTAMIRLNEAVIEALNTPKSDPEMVLIGLILLLRQGHGRLEESVTTSLQTYLTLPVASSDSAVPNAAANHPLGQNERLRSEAGLACLAAVMAPEKSSIPLADRLFDRALAAAREVVARSKVVPGSEEDGFYESSIWLLKSEFLSACGEKDAAAAARTMAVETSQP